MGNFTSDLIKYPATKNLDFSEGLNGAVAFTVIG